MEKKLNKLIGIGIITLVVVVAIGVAVFSNRQVKETLNLGGGGLGDFAATSTYFAESQSIRTIKTGNGTLGRVVITKAPQSGFTIFDATTTNANLRVPQATSSLPVLASFPASATVGTYDFDAVFSSGLLFVADGLVGSSTILYK